MTTPDSPKMDGCDVLKKLDQVRFLESDEIFKRRLWLRRKPGETRTPPLFDFLFLRVGDVGQFPETGKSLVIVGIDDENKLHLQIFDQDGTKIIIGIDDENQLHRQVFAQDGTTIKDAIEAAVTAQVQAMTSLGQRLEKCLGKNKIAELRTRVETVLGEPLANGCDYRLITFENPTELPEQQRNNMVVVRIDDNDQLRLQLFDHDGKKIKDTDEATLTAQAQARFQAAARLKKQITLRPGEKEETRVCDEIKTILNADPGDVLKCRIRVEGDNHLRLRIFHRNGELKDWSQVDLETQAKAVGELKDLVSPCVGKDEISAVRYEIGTIFGMSLTGLCLSGGGIRSACFNLGFLEGLDRLEFNRPGNSKTRDESSSRHNHLEVFDYISSVSGGSYANGHLAATSNNLDLYNFDLRFAGDPGGAANRNEKQILVAFDEKQVHIQIFNQNRKLIKEAARERSKDDFDAINDLEELSKTTRAGQEITKDEKNRAISHVKSIVGDAWQEDAWLGNVPLSSKTVPNWLWVLGVWILGVAFQVMKTGALLVAGLALIAFCMRTLDAPDADSLWQSYGVDNDVTRGFVPFWFSLWIFGVAYWIKKARFRDFWFWAWVLLAAVVVLAYLSVIYWHHDDVTRGDDTMRGIVILLYSLLLVGSARRVIVVFRSRTTSIQRCLWVGLAALFLFLAVNLGLYELIYRQINEAPGTVPFYQHFFLLTLLSIPLFFIIIIKLVSFSPWKGNDRDDREDEQERNRPSRFEWLRRYFRTDPDVQDDSRQRAMLRYLLLIPILVALFCFAGLVTTGDIALTPTGGDDVPMSSFVDKPRSEWYGELGDEIYKIACVILAVLSLAFVFPIFPKNLFKSMRTLEEHDTGRVQQERESWSWRLGIEPVLRVIVFLCSYGFVLLAIFVVYSTVARENVSGYYDWRKEIPRNAFHFTDFVEESREFAWERIAVDANRNHPSGFVGPPRPRSLTIDDVARAPWESPDRWTALAKLFMKARDQSDYPLEQDRADAARIRVLKQLSWFERLTSPFKRYSLLGWTWPDDRSRELVPSVEEQYELLASQNEKRRLLAEKIADLVLGDVELYKIIPDVVEKPDPKTIKIKWNSDRYEGLYDRYQQRAKALAASSPADSAPKGEKEAFQAAVRNNNRRALNLYLPGLLRDRRDQVVYASIVWYEDQWTRLRIFALAVVIWLLCCAVNVNTFSLQSFYRTHVVENWVNAPGPRHPWQWLHHSRGTYTSCVNGEDGKPRFEQRRAPLLLFHATYGGNRSLGNEPELDRDIFTFSALASGSKETGFWTTEEKHKDHKNERTEKFARRNHLDTANIVTTSGAFLSPGTIANPALSAVLHLLNIQTGIWAHKPKEYKSRALGERLKFHLGQSLGVDSDNSDSRFMLTDGAHSDNLGLYALLQRRCKLIVASDCSQQDASETADRRFDALILVIQQARVEGIEIGPFLNSRAYRDWVKTNKYPEDDRSRSDCCYRWRSTGLNLVRPPDQAAPEAKAAKRGMKINIEGQVAKANVEHLSQAEPGSAGAMGASNGKPLSPAGKDEAEAGMRFSQEHYLFSRITYPDRTQGLIVYLRPTLTGDEGDHLLNGVAGSSFPDDDPVDQFYSPSRMNTYRLLGRHIAMELMEDPVMSSVLQQFLLDKPLHTLDKLDSTSSTATCTERCGGPSHRCQWHLARSLRRSCCSTNADSPEEKKTEGGPTEIIPATVNGDHRHPSPE